MSYENMISSKIIIWHHFLCLILAPILCDAWHFNTSFYILWCSDNKFNQHTSYESNLKSLLSSLTSNAAISAKNGYYTTNTTTMTKTDVSETIYGYFGCRGDTTTEDCQKCVTDAISYLPPKECPSDKGVVIWYRSCKVRYSNKFFLGIVDEKSNYGWSNDENVSTVTNNVDGFMRSAGDTLHDLGTQVSSRSLGKGHPKYFGTKTMTLNNLKLYTMASCVADLAPSDCDKCLGIVSNVFSSCCYGSKGGTVLNPSCYARFEIYPFYNSTASGPQSQPLLSPLSLPQGDSNRRTPVSSREHRRRTKLLYRSLLGALLTSLVLSFLLFFGIRIYKRKRTKEKCDVDMDEIKTVLDSLEFDFNTIKTATSNFSADYKIGEGGFGEVYKGKLKHGDEVAVKRLSKNTGHGIEQFKTEVALVARLQHKNLVKLLGFCESSKEKMLVYEFLPNSSLDRFLFGPKEEILLDWQTRLKIIVGIARGLLYLHEDSRLKIVHRDLKSSNILLDDDMNPKISDFGLAKLFGEDQTQGDTRKIVGTYGYLAPEYAITGRYSVKSDVYSFGVIILEILSGRRNSYYAEKQHEEGLLSYAWRLWNEDKPLDIVDATLNNQFSKDEALKCIHIGLLCIQEHANERPNMALIVAALNGQATNFPMPKAPLFAETRLINAKRLEDFDSSSTYSGFDTITVLHPRD